MGTYYRVVNHTHREFFSGGAWSGGSIKWVNTAFGNPAHALALLLMPGGRWNPPYQIVGADPSGMFLHARGSYVEILGDRTDRFYDIEGAEEPTEGGGGRSVHPYDHPYLCIDKDVRELLAPFHREMGLFHPERGKAFVTDRELEALIVCIVGPSQPVGAEDMERLRRMLDAMFG